MITPKMMVQIIFLVSIDNNSKFAVEPIGCFIWQSLGKKGTIYIGVAAIQQKVSKLRCQERRF
jgi:hypothetical protein